MKCSNIYAMRSSWRIQFILIILIAAGCSSQMPEETQFYSEMQEIKGRDNDQNPFPVYRIKAPDEWIRRDPLPDESLIDTTKALCEFIIFDKEEMIRIWIHNFPTENAESKIPPMAQIQRWQNQFDLLDPNFTRLIPEAFNGYCGWMFSGRGFLKDADMCVFAWALQIAQEHDQTLSSPKSFNELALFRQMRADVTIKAEGPPALMEKNKEAIAAFARSFELIEEVPAPLYDP